MPVGEGDGGAAAPNLSHHPACGPDPGRQVPPWRGAQHCFPPIGAPCRSIEALRVRPVPCPPPGTSIQHRRLAANSATSPHFPSLPHFPPTPAGFARVAWVITTQLRVPARADWAAGPPPAPPLAGGRLPPAATARHPHLPHWAFAGRGQRHAARHTCWDPGPECACLRDALKLYPSQASGLHTPPAVPIRCPPRGAAGWRCSGFWAKVHVLQLA